MGQMEQRERVGTHVWNITLTGLTDSQLEKKLSGVNWLSGSASEESLNFSEPQFLCL